MSRINWKRLQNRYILENTPIPATSGRSDKFKMSYRSQPDSSGFERWLMVTLNYSGLP
jgi:hypothetical protein